MTYEKAIFLPKIGVAAPILGRKIRLLRKSLKSNLCRNMTKVFVFLFLHFFYFKLSDLIFYISISFSLLCERVLASMFEQYL